MAFTFSNLAQAVWASLGRVPAMHQFVATGGTDTTIVNSKWSSREDAPEDNYCIDWTAIVVRDAGGAGADPEGKLARVSAYNSSTWTYTIDTVTTAIAAGDEIMIANADIPLQEMYRCANLALREFECQSEDSSLTMSSTTYRYLLPVGCRRDFPIRVEWEDDYYNRKPVQYTISADNYLHVPSPEDGEKLYITYIGPHATLTAYNSAISEDIHPNVAIEATKVAVLDWLNASQGGSSNFWLQEYNKAAMKLEQLKYSHPVKKYPRQTKWSQFNYGSQDDSDVDTVHIGGY